MTAATSELQRWDADRYEAKARFVGALAEDAVALLALRPGERILDIGCGDGHLSVRLEQDGATVVGVDYSPELVAAARARGLTVHHANAERLVFLAEFDAAFSNAALARRGIDPAIVDPWYLPTADGYRDVLEAAGFGVTDIVLFDRPVVIDYPVAQWIRTFGSPYLTVLPDEPAKDTLLDEVTQALADELLGADGRWTIDYTRLRFRATIPR